MRIYHSNQEEAARGVPTAPGRRAGGAGKREVGPPVYTLPDTPALTDRPRVQVVSCDCRPKVLTILGDEASFPPLRFPLSPFPSHFWPSFTCMFESSPLSLLLPFHSLSRSFSPGHVLFFVNSYLLSFTLFSFLSPFLLSSISLTPLLFPFSSLLLKLFLPFPFLCSSSLHFISHPLSLPFLCQFPSLLYLSFFPSIPFFVPSS